MALRSTHEAGRRFDLARLVGDRLFSEIGFIAGEPLSPATRSLSYRQQAQRGFAAELLCPQAAALAMLGDDCSGANRERVAGYFMVPERIIAMEVDMARRERL